MLVNEIIAIFVGLLVIWIGITLVFGKKMKIDDFKKRVEISRPKKVQSNIEAIMQSEKEETFLNKLQLDLDRAQIKMKSNMFALCVVMLCCIFTLLLGVLFKNAFCLIGIAIGIIIPKVYIKNKKAKFQEQFNTEMVKALKRMSATLRINDSIDQALKDIVESKIIPEMVRKEFAKVYSSIKVGNPVNESFYELYKAVPTNEVRYLCVSLDIQLQAGGDKSAILDDICDQINEKNELKAAAKSKIVEIMLSVKIMACLPIVFILILSTTDAGVVSFYTSSVVGELVALGIAGMIGAGYFVIKKMSKIDI